MNTAYNVQEWAAGIERGGQVFNYNYRMLGNELKDWQLIKVVTLQEGPDAIEKAYMWQSKADPEHEMVRVDITERHDWRQALESLHQHLMECMRTDIPRGTKDLARLGDIVFVSRDPEASLPGAVSFTRGNMLISVSSVGEKNIDVSDFAAKLDSALNDPPANREMASGKVRALSPTAKPTLKANEAHVLIDELPKAASGGEWLKIMVSDGELSRKGDALIYVPAQGGEKQVETFAISRD
jgi:hypothetical protein